MMALMSLSAVKDITQLPGAIFRFERDVKLYERGAGRVSPQEFKIPTVLRLLPKTHELELKLKFAMGLTTVPSSRSRSGAPRSRSASRARTHAATTTWM